jgi:hypothetical protein
MMPCGSPDRVLGPVEPDRVARRAELGVVGPQCARAAREDGDAGTGPASAPERSRWRDALGELPPDFSATSGVIRA